MVEGIREPLISCPSIPESELWGWLALLGTSPYLNSISRRRHMILKDYSMQESMGNEILYDLLSVSYVNV